MGKTNGEYLRVGNYLRDDLIGQIVALDWAEDKDRSAKIQQSLQQSLQLAAPHRKGFLFDVRDWSLKDYDFLQTLVEAVEEDMGPSAMSRGLGFGNTPIGHRATDPSAQGEAVTKKPAWQLDREIAEALVAAKSRPSPSAEVLLRTRLPHGLGSIIRRTQMAMLDAMKNNADGSYTFESSNGGVIRAFWKKLTDVYYQPPSGAGGRAIGQAAGKKLAELWPIVKTSWPEALSE